jgi:predicted Zn-dependent protease
MAKPYGNAAAGGCHVCPQRVPAVGRGECVARWRTTGIAFAKATFRLLCIGLALGALLACSTPSVAPIGSAGSEESTGEERDLRREADRIERLIERSDLVYPDAELRAYLNNIARALVTARGAQGYADVRVQVLEQLSVNAFALPNGAIFLHTGMLARLENEAQLAALLGHEITHYTHRHGLRQQYEANRQQVLARAVQVFVTVLAAGPAGAEAARAWTLASVSGYSRELEAEADREGLRCMAAAGYDPRQAVRMMQHIQEELEALGMEEALFLYSSHPRLQERIQSYRSLLRAELEEPTARRGEAAYMEHVRELLLEDAEANIEAERWGPARADLEKHLSRWPESARGHYVLGRLHERSRTGPDALKRARAEFARATELDPEYADPHRALGFLHRAQGKELRARAAFKRYMALAPEAPDRPLVEAYLRAARADTTEE